NGGRMARFKPDFIFWLQRGDRYWIVFVDPKGLAHTDWMHKVEGYRSLFEQGGRPREWRHNGLTVQVLLRLYTDDVSKAPSEYRRYCADTIGGIFCVAGEKDTLRYSVAEGSSQRREW
ncbi:MAG: hypothetical protein NZ749_14580, partial [bacterium]|nr:hypothetical protein [bacterium]